MKTPLQLSFAIALLALSVALPNLRAANANPPDRMSYQGYLVDANGVPLGSNAPVNHTVEFRIYNVSSGGSSVWDEQQTVTIDKGYFSVLLGDGVGTTHPSLSTIFTGADASDRYIGVKDLSLSGSTEILPRLRLITSPYAYMASTLPPGAITNGLFAAASITGDKLATNTLDATKFSTNVGLWTASGANVYRTGGNVGIGINPTLAKLHVAGTGLFDGVGFGTPALTIRQGAGSGAGFINGHADLAITDPIQAYLALSGTLGSGIYFGGNGPNPEVSIDLLTGVGLRVVTGTNTQVPLTLLHNGHVGIMTTPSAALDVAKGMNGLGSGTAFRVSMTDSGLAETGIRVGEKIASPFEFLPLRVLYNGSELMRVNGNSVGIGTTSPGSKLHVDGGNNATLANGTGFLLIGSQTGFNVLFDDNEILARNNGAGSDLYLNSKSGSGHTILNQVSGNVGIGTASSPTRARFELNGAVNSTAAIFGGDTTGIGIGANWPSIGFNRYYSGSGHRAISAGFNADIELDPATGNWYFVVGGNTAANANITSSTAMTIANSGNVGIGNTSPTQGRLVVSGFGHASTIGRSYENTGVNTAYNNPDTWISIYASHGVAAQHFVAQSDARIKRVKGRSDIKEDLETLCRIEVTDYTYVDTVAYGSGTQKKLLAQQVEKAFPEAVSKRTDVVPDIYQKATIKDGWVMLNTDLKKGDRVKLICDKTEGIHEVLEVAEGRFRTDFNQKEDKVFVYGREVNDFRSVDYDAIAMLNVSATQELARKVKAQEEELTELRAELSQLRNERKSLAENVSRLEATFTRLEKTLNNRTTVIEAKATRSDLAK